ncbi:TetR/AcrR family transcriptional regulator [Amycolatopsis anabasis]|uniref:TetR/AcrR family transcriptional regulator n=1 Tax=Amycolatopsis anabasis TaxID=1840409 RepID=UPI00131CB0F5|nr:TetR family transcriptional regulator [Amycolatopsis anabasis]
MARPPEPGRRAVTLAKATDYVLGQGLSGLSLRPLAAALGTSTRMLLYDFGSKEKLVSEVLAEARRRLSAQLAEYLDTVEDASRAGMLGAIWEWLTDAENTPYLRLFFEVQAHALTHPEAYADGGRALVTDWLDFFGDQARPDRLDPAAATLVVATLRGLLLDRFLSGDVRRTDEALARFTALLAP